MYADTIKNNYTNYEHVKKREKKQPEPEEVKKKETIEEQK